MSTGPLVVDTHELGRRPGAERTYTLTIGAPANLGSDVYGVPEGSTIDIELRLDAIMEGILATGTGSGQTKGECVRCLTDIEGQLDFDFQELYHFSDPDEDELALDGDLLDLEPVLREAMVFALPLNPVCDPDCPGLCPDCGARLADDPDHTHQAAIDPRWSVLKDLKE